MPGETAPVAEGETTAEVDGGVVMDPLLEMIAGTNRLVTTVGTVIVAEENEEEDQSGRRIP